MISNRYCLLWSAVVVLAGGCQSLPKVDLGSCETQNTERFVQAFQFHTADDMRYQYHFSRKGLNYACNGISHRKGKSVYLAGYSNSGVTDFSAVWEDGQFHILRNNTRIPGSFLEQSILTDLLLPYHQPVDKIGCVYLNSSDGSLWLQMKNDIAGNSGYYAIKNNRAAWMGLKKDRICYQANHAASDNTSTVIIRIDNLQQDYQAEMRIISGVDQGSFQAN
jgi:hypothetical protein